MLECKTASPEAGKVTRIVLCATEGDCSSSHSSLLFARFVLIRTSAVRMIHGLCWDYNDTLVFKCPQRRQHAWMPFLDVEALAMMKVFSTVFVNDDKNPVFAEQKITFPKMAE